MNPQTIRWPNSRPAQVPMPQCLALVADDKICGGLATSFDAERGVMVCDVHRNPKPLAEQILGPLDVLSGPDNPDGTNDLNAKSAEASVQTGAGGPDKGPAVQAISGVHGGSPYPGGAIDGAPYPGEEPGADPGGEVTFTSRLDFEAHLTAEEHLEFLTCKKIIDRNLEKFVEVGLAFNTIRQKRLYRETHGTFEDWCEETYGTTARQVYRLCRAAEMVQDWRTRALTLTPGSQFPYPAGEKTIRPLLALPQEEQMDAWYEAVSKHPSFKPSFRDVQAIVRERLARNGMPVPEAAPKAPPKPIDVSPVGAPKEERLRPLVEKALESTRELVDEIRTADSSEAASLSVALDLIQRFKDHLAKVQRMQERRKL